MSRFTSMNECQRQATLDRLWESARADIMAKVNGIDDLVRLDESATMACMAAIAKKDHARYVLNMLASMALLQLQHMELNRNELEEQTRG